MTPSKSFRSGIIALILTSGVVLAQDQPPAPPQPAAPSNGGWRRVGDPPPVPQQSPATAPQTDPTEPVDRSDAYGQPVQNPPQDMPQQTMPPQSMPPQTMPPESMPPQTMQRQTPPPQVNRPAYGIPTQLTLRPGTFFTVRINEGLASNHNRAGDLFTATLTQPIIVNGVVVAQRGQTVAGVVADTGKDKNGKHFIRLNLNSITAADGTRIPVQTQLTSMQGRTTPGGVEAGTVVATTAVGAAIGGVAAWGTGAAIGAGAGALAGIAAVVATHNHPAVIYPETAMTFQITQPVTISTAAAPQAFRYAGPGDFQPQPTMMRAQPRPYPAPVYAYPRPYYGPAYYPYYPYYYGPSFGVVIGRGWGRRW